MLSYVERDVNDIPFFLVWSMDVTEILDAIHGVDVHVFLERLAKCLNLLGSSPYASLPGLGHLGIKATFFVLCGRGIGGRCGTRR